MPAGAPPRPRPDTACVSAAGGGGARRGAAGAPEEARMQKRPSARWLCGCRPARTTGRRRDAPQVGGLSLRPEPNLPGPKARKEIANRLMPGKQACDHARALKQTWKSAVRQTPAPRQTAGAAAPRTAGFQTCFGPKARDQTHARKTSPQPGAGLEADLEVCGTSDASATTVRRRGSATYRRFPNLLRAEGPRQDPCPENKTATRREP
jgi:hypothetical protein